MIWMVSNWWCMDIPFIFIPDISWICRYHQVLAAYPHVTISTALNRHLPIFGAGRTGHATCNGGTCEACHFFRDVAKYQIIIKPLSNNVWYDLICIIDVEYMFKPFQTDHHTNWRLLKRFKAQLGMILQSCVFRVRTQVPASRQPLAFHLWAKHSSGCQGLE